MPRLSNFVIGSLRYSDNLGDGVIGDCLAYMLGALRPGADVRHVDIAGRDSFQPRASSQVGLSRSAIYALPGPARSAATLAAWPFFHRRRIIAAWKSSKPNSPYLFIFAGGQIISDIALNFPLKIDLVSKLIVEDKASAAVFAAGVSKKFSPVGRALFQRAFTRLRFPYFGVRDAGSLRNVNQFKLGPQVVRMAVDPAVWASETYGARRAINPKPRIGLGVAHPRELAVHLPGGSNTGEENAIEFWGMLVSECHRRGYLPILFNNGSAEDAYFTDAVSQRLRVTHGDIFQVADRPMRPSELVRCIASFDTVVAHRLHANIISYALSIPSVGIEWDSKVPAFFQETNRASWCVPATAAATHVSSLIADALRVPLDEQHLEHLKCRAQRELGILLERSEA